MSTEFNQNAVSSMSSVINSIENDRQVYRWFLMLISLPEIQQKLSEEDKTKKEYQALKKIQTAEIATYIALALITVASYLTKEPWTLLLGVLPLAILVILFQRNRKRVAAISEQFLLKNIQPNELNQQTLYQSCEYFSKKYNTPSLVDIITYQDFIGRKVLLGAILFIPFIYPFKSWQILVATLVVYLVTLAIVNTSIVLRKLK
jgi:hypothetical protein